MAGLNFSPRSFMVSGESLPDYMLLPTSAILVAGDFLTVGTNACVRLSSKSVRVSVILSVSNWAIVTTAEVKQVIFNTCWVNRVCFPVVIFNFVTSRLS